jgi:O-antigen/teichoic acid export membrane protein
MPLNGVSAGKSGLLRATLLNLAGLMVPVTVQLLTVPLYIKSIGMERYGVMALVWLLLGYFGFFDLGFGRAIASRLAGLSSVDADTRENVFWTGACLSVAAGAVGGVIFYLVAVRLFGMVFNVPDELQSEVSAALPFMAMALPVVTGISALSGALQGCEAFGAMNFSQMTGGVLYQLFPFVVAVDFSSRLPWLVLAAIAGRLVTAVMLFLFCRQYVPAKKQLRIKTAEIKPLLGFGGWVTLTGMISPLLTVFDRMVIGTVAGMGAVSAYTIPYNLVMRIAALPSSVQNALYPRFAMLESEGAGQLQMRAVRLICGIMTPAVVTGVLGMRLFLALWVGSSLANISAPVGQILLIGLWVNTLAFIPFSFLQSRGRPDLPAKFHVVELVFYAPVLYFLTRFGGVAGAAWAWNARVFMDAILLFFAAGILNLLLECAFGFCFVLAGFLWAAMAWRPFYGFGSVVIVAGSLAWSLWFLRMEMMWILRRQHGIMAVQP